MKFRYGRRPWKRGGRPDVGSQHKRDEAPADTGLLESAPAEKRARLDASRERDGGRPGVVGRWTARIGLLLRVRRFLRSPGFRRWLTGERPEPAPSLLGLAEEPAPGKIGICCSGGGIRSAAFNLGTLQFLQDHGVLQRATYLAAVSGGSYIAAGFCMVAKTPGANGDSTDDSDPTLVTPEHPPFHPGSPEEQYLRNRSSYLAPDGTAKAFLAFRILMGLLFNLFFLGLPLFALGVGLGALADGTGYGDLTGADTTCTDGTGAGCGLFADIPAWAGVSVAAVAGIAVTLGVINLLVRFRRDRVRRALETWTVRALLATLAVALALIAVPVGVDLLYGQSATTGDATDAAAAKPLPVGGFFGTLALLAGVLLQLRRRITDVGAIDSVKASVKGLRALGPKLQRAFVYVAGALVGPALLLCFVVYGAAVAIVASDQMRLALAGAGLGAFLALYSAADLNSWSLHPFYRRRLCSAFALKRVKNRHGEPEARERAYDHLVELSKSGVEPGPSATAWPTLLVCAAANISDPGATPAGRGVTSFTFSPTAIGGPLVGVVPTVAYEQALGHNRRRDITLPAAVAMSGAALAPSMGKVTRRPLTFLLALANVRLGVWVPNPRHIEAEWSRPKRLERFGQWVRGLLPRGKDKGPRDYRRVPRPSYLLRELLGQNRVDDRFLYVSDGGHYENLGLVELLRRGCTEVYCFDAGGGTSTAELGDAIALARSELGVEIDIDASALVERGSPTLAERDCVPGAITYAEGQQGTLVYARR